MKNRKNSMLNRLILLSSTGLFFLLLGIGYYYDTSFFHYTRSFLRFSVIKSIEFVTLLYDPSISSSPVKLYPEDWQGWPPDAVQPRLAVERLQAALTGDSIHLREIKTFSFGDKLPSFAYESLRSRELEELRAIYKFDSFIDRSIPQIDQIMELNNWVRSQWVHGSNRDVNFFRFNALDILEQAKKGAQYWCQVASMTFIQAVVAAGYQARLISLYADPNREPEHAVAEVWVDDLEKWIVFDTDFNIYYVSRFGIPLSALEIHKMFVTGNSEKIKVVKGIHRPENYDIEAAAAQPLLLPYYKYFCVDMRNDWLSNTYFIGHPKRSDQNSTCWDGGLGMGDFNMKPTTQYESELYWSINGADIRIYIDSIEKNSIDVTVHLQTITPNFNRFEIEENSIKRICYSSSFKWQLRPGRNAFTARAVNDSGQMGSPSSLSIAWKKNSKEYLEAPS